MRKSSPCAIVERDPPAEHLGGVLGPDRYTALTDQGRVMAPADAVRYSFEQIEGARSGL